MRVSGADPEQRSLLRLLRLLLAASLLGAVAWFSRGFWLGAELDGAAVRTEVQRWGAWAPIGSLLMMTLQALISPIPMAVVVVANGALFGPAAGVALSALGELCGATAAYALARLGLAPTVPEAILSRVQEQVGFWHLLALRLVPGLSVDLVSYACGAVRVSWPVFAGSTVLGLLPRTFLFTVFGQELLQNPERTLAWTLSLGVPLWLGIAWHLTRRRRSL